MILKKMKKKKNKTHMKGKKIVTIFQTLSH